MLAGMMASDWTSGLVPIVSDQDGTEVPSYGNTVSGDRPNSPHLCFQISEEYCMSIDVTCSGCGKAYAVPDERAGQRFKCKACGTAVSVPADEWGNDFTGNAAFGGNAAGFADPQNPYAAPITSGPGGHRISKAEALSKTKICAIFLFIITGLSVVHHLFVGISTLIMVIANPAVMNQNPETTGQVVGGLAGGSIGIIMDILVITGAYNLMGLKKRSMALTGAIIACIPCCGPCFVLGIPFGIWALVLINSQEIKPHFES